jgi:hypothetical protein
VREALISLLSAEHEHMLYSFPSHLHLHKPRTIDQNVLDRAEYFQDFGSLAPKLSLRWKALQDSYASQTQTIVS